MSRKLPFEHIRFNSQVEDAVKAGTRPAIPNNVNPDFRQIIEACWQQEPSNRPSITDVVNPLELLNQRAQFLTVPIASSIHDDSMHGGESAAENDPLLHTEYTGIN